MRMKKKKSKLFEEAMGGAPRSNPTEKKRATRDVMLYLTIGGKQWVRSWKIREMGAVFIAQM